MPEPATPPDGAPSARHSAWEVLRVFLKLGATSFGGPIAHLGYFRTEFVERRAWMSDEEYADLVALCQFLPGPASSQVGFAIGLRRAGLLGALAAFAAFTLPSAALMVVFAFGAARIDGPIGAGLISGLQIVAVAVVAQAVIGMARTLAPDRSRASIAVCAAVLVLLLPGSLGQVAAIAFGGVTGLALGRRGLPAEAPARPSGPVRPAAPRRATGIVCLVLFACLLALLPVVVHATGGARSDAAGGLALFDAFATAGALVFGGGHVVLPLLEASVVAPGWVPAADFIAGYGAAQAMPGPLFSFAAFLGADSTVGPGGHSGAAIALTAIFLPGLLLLIGVLPFWEALRERHAVRGFMRGANAAVVGVLAAALYSPVFTTAVLGSTDHGGAAGPTGPAGIGGSTGAFALALVCFALLVVWKLPPWVAVLAGAAGGVLLAALRGFC